MKMRFRGFGVVALLMGGLLLSGCVSKEIEPEAKPRLGVARSGDNYVVFALESKVGYKYAIHYQDQKDQKWKPVKGCESIIGTGETIEIKKRFNSRGPLPPFTVKYSKL